MTRDNVAVVDSFQAYTPVDASPVSVMVFAVPRDALDTFADRRDTIHRSLRIHSNTLPQDLGEEM